MFIEELKSMLKPMLVEDHPSDYRKQIVTLRGAGCVFVGRRNSGQCEQYIAENEHKYKRGYDMVGVAERI